MKKSSKFLMLIMGAFLLSGFNLKGETVQLKTSDFSLSINDKGIIESIKDGKGNEHLLKKIPSLILRLKTFSDKKIELPRKMTWSKKEGFTLLNLDFAKSSAVVKVEEKEDYLTLELQAVKGNEAELIMWGPINLTIKKTIGESLGVVYNDQYGIGILALNIKTSGGYKSNWGSYMTNTAMKVNGGARLLAHSKDMTKPKTFNYGKQKHIHVTPIKGETVVGSKIAFYGTKSSNILPLIGEIEIAEGLPHPKYKGQWLKQSRYATPSKLITNYKASNFDDFLALAKKAGIRIIYNGGLFKSWGTFEVNPNIFPGGMAQLKECVAKAEKQGIVLGAHTLSNFIHTNDPLITPIPHPGLLRAGKTSLKEDLNTKATEIILADDTPIEAYQRGARGEKYAVQIGNELIEFSNCSKSRPWKLTGCKRGAFGTKISSHKAGAKTSKLVSLSYGVFMPTIELQDQMAKRLADFYNESGLKSMGFDGLEGCLRTGHERYACDRYVKVYYDNLKDKSVIISGSMLPHYTWHMTTNESWGEPWYGDFRQSMMDHRLGAQKFLVRNKLPSKLGQFRINKKVSIEDINWIMTLCAGLNSGVDFYIKPSIFTDHPNGKELVETIRRWEIARVSGQFTEAEKADMKKPNTIYTLVPDGKKLKLKFVKDWVKEKQQKKEQKKEQKMTLMKGIFGEVAGSELSDDYVHINKPREPGQPTAAFWDVKNSGSKEQPLQFVLRSAKENKQNVKDAYFKIGAIVSKIPFEIKPGDCVVAKGDGKLSYYSKTGKPLKKKDFKDLTLAKGENDIEFNNFAQGENPGPKVILNFKTYLPGYSLTTGKPVTSSNNSKKASLATDGKIKNSKDHWADSVSKNKIPWLQVDLQKPEVLKKIILVPYHDGKRYYQFTIETSLDGKKWQKIIDKSNNTSPVPKGGECTFNIKPTKARYIKVNMLKHNHNNNVHIVEIMAF